MLPAPDAMTKLLAEISTQRKRVSVCTMMSYRIGRGQSRS